MEFGTEFEDDFFEEPRQRKEEKPTKYEAKFCRSEWFFDQEFSGKEDKEEILNNLKHRAEFLYFTHRYSEASEIYKQCLEMLPVTNTTARRECMENVARSLLHQGCKEETLEWALKLHATSCNTDQQVVSWSLLATVCHYLKKYKEELEALHCCIQVHQWNADFWMRLAFCYAGLFDIQLSNCDISKEKVNQGGTCSSLKNEPCVLHSEACAGTLCESANLPLDDATHNTLQCNHSDRDMVVPDQDQLEVKTSDSQCEMCSLGKNMVSACLIRSRLLLHGCYSGHRSFGKEKNFQQQQKITECLRHLNVDQNFIDEAVKMLSQDVFFGMREDGQANLSEQSQPLETNVSYNL